MIKNNRSQATPFSRNHSKTRNVNTRLPSARVQQPQIANKLSPTPFSAVPRRFSASKNFRKNNEKSFSRSKSAPPGPRQQHSSSVLDIRGKFYENGKTFDMMSHLKGKSFPRRIHRLINEIPDNTSENRNDHSNISVVEVNCTEDAVPAGQISLNNKQLLERRRGLHQQRSTNRSEVSELVRIPFINHHCSQPRSIYFRLHFSPIKS